MSVLIMIALQCLLNLSHLNELKSNNDKPVSCIGEQGSLARAFAVCIHKVLMLMKTQTKI